MRGPVVKKASKQRNESVEKWEGLQICGTDKQQWESTEKY